jgi:prepilin-type processing-associated H-X9-DG protein
MYKNQQRVRSVSANCYMGTTVNESHNFGEITPGYYFFNKYSTIIGKFSVSDAFVFTDENPDSLNDGFLLVRVDGSVNDRPAVNHGESSSLSYADGHAALHKWQDAFRVPKPLSGTADPWWLAAHTTVHR